MPAGPELRRRVLAGEPIVGTFLNLGSAAVAEVCGRAGFDWLLIDLEHGVGTEADLLAMLYAAKATGTPVVVRPEQGTRLRIGRVLDLGADGVMVPAGLRARRGPRSGLVAALPAGRQARRGALHARPGLRRRRPRAARSRATRRSWASPRSSRRQPWTAADETASIEGIDVLFVGPTDLTHALGIPGQIDHPAYQSAIAKVAAAAKAHGKATGVLLWKPEHVRRYAELGFTFFAISSDGGLLDVAVRGALDATRAALG